MGWSALNVLSRLANWGEHSPLSARDVLLLYALEQQLDLSGVTSDGLRSLAVLAFSCRRRAEIPLDLFGGLGISSELIPHLIADSDVETLRLWAEPLEPAVDAAARALRRVEALRSSLGDCYGSDSVVKALEELQSLELSALVDKYLETRQKTPQHGDVRVISVQIDMSGSTRAKARIRSLTHTDLARRRHLYAEVVTRLVEREVAFFVALQSDGVSAQPSIPFSRCNTIKGIGDEQWLFVIPDNNTTEELRAIAVRCIHAALHVVHELQFVSLLPEGQEPEWLEEHSMPSPSSAIALPFKVYIDVVGLDCINTSHVRTDVFFDAFASGKLVCDSHKILADALTRLTGYPTYAGRGTLETTIRSDYVGWEIDRVFRASKAALPGVVTVGNALFEVLQPVLNSEAGSSGARRIQLPGGPFRQLGATWREMDELKSAKHILRTDDLRGIGESYSVHHLFVTRCLDSLHRQLSHWWNDSEGMEDLTKLDRVLDGA